LLEFTLWDYFARISYILVINYISIIIRRNLDLDSNIVMVIIAKALYSLDNFSFVVKIIGFVIGDKINFNFIWECMVMYN
jgi:hypothetical protein